MFLFDHTGFCSFFGVGFTNKSLYRTWHGEEGFPLDSIYDLDNYRSDMYEFISSKLKDKGLILLPTYIESTNYDAFIGVNGSYISELEFLSYCGVPPIHHRKASSAAEELVKMGYEDQIRAFVVPIKFGIKDGVEIFNGIAME